MPQIPTLAARMLTSALVRHETPLAASRSTRRAVYRDDPVVEDSTSERWTGPHTAPSALVGDPLDRASTLSAVRRGLLAAPVRDLTLARHILLRRLGAGGSGVVYEAFDPELSRKVALKLLKTGASRDPSVGAARLKREAQAMARVSHPNVITVYDVGTYGDGDLDNLLHAPAAGASRSEIPPAGVFVVMELVEGPNLRGWMVSEASWRTKLSVLVAAGRGLAAAHAEGLVHRDFKPDNVLVGRPTASAAAHRVRVVDFGLARPADPSSASPGPRVVADDDAAIPMTVSGTIAGTPAYMSPEQHAGATADARSDQYNFCVTAFEVLAGARPFAGEDRARLAHEKAHGVPRSPPRGSPVPERVWRALRRGMSARPEDRFASMDALLGALQRTPARWAVRAAIGGAIAIPLAAYSGGSTPDGCHAHTQPVAEAWAPSVQEGIARRIGAALGERGPAVWAKAQSRLQAYADAWTQARTEACRALPRTGSAAAMDALDRQTSCLERRRLDFVATIQLLSDADPSALHNTLELVDSLTAPARCRDPGRDAPLLPPPGAERLEANAILGDVARANMLGIVGNHQQRRRVTQRAIERARALGHGPTLARALVERGMTLWDDEALDEALATLHEGIVVAERHADARTAVEGMLLTAGLLSKARREDDRALQLLDWVRARSEDPVVHSRAARYRALIWLRTAQPQRAADELTEAIAVAEAALGADTPNLTGLLVALANAHSALGQFARAQQAYERALQLRRDVFGEGPGEAMIHNNLGAVFLAQHDRARACASHQRAHDMFVTTYGAEHSTVAMSLNNLGLCHSMRHDAEAALRTHRQSLAIKVKTLGADHPDCGYSHVNIGDVLLELGRPEEAADAHRRGQRVWATAWGAEHPRLAVPAAGLADAALATGDVQAAARWVDRGLSLIPDDQMRPTRIRLLFTRGRIQAIDDPRAAVTAVTALRREAATAEDPILADQIDAWLSAARRPKDPSKDPSKDPRPIP